MIFVKIHRKIKTKKALDKEYMFSLFRKRRKNFLTAKAELIDLKIELIRNFRGKFRNMSLRYELLTNKGSKIVRAKIHNQQDIPQREWRILNWLKKFGLGKNVPCPLDYFAPLNIFFYREAPGISLEQLLSQQKIVIHLKSVGRIAQWLKRAHQISAKPNFLPLKTIKQELKERRHWFFLVRKCAPDFYGSFKKLLKELWYFKQKNKDLFLKHSQFGMVHGDFHWGNIIYAQNQFRIIDFGYAFQGDPLEDAGGFLAQNTSMFRYYAPKFSQRGQRIRKIFLKNYFPKGLSISEEARLIYFEVQKILEMAAILALIEPNEENKARGITTLLKKAEEKLKNTKY